MKAFGPRDPTTSSFKGVTDHQPAAADPETERSEQYASGSKYFTHANIFAAGIINLKVVRIIFQTFKLD